MELMDRDYMNRTPEEREAEHNPKGVRGYSGHLYISVQRKNTVPAAPMSAKTVL